MPLIKKGPKPIVLLISLFLLISLACQISNPLAQPTPDFNATASAVVESVQTTDNPPMLVEIQPINNSVLGMDNSITLYFDQPMDKQSVETAISITPEMSGNFEWQNNDTVTFFPTVNYEPDSIIEFTIADTALGANGLAISSQKLFSFQTASNFKLTEALPKPDSENNNPSNAIIASFNLPIVPIETEPEDQPSAFTLKPYAKGNGEWINTSTYVFYPDPPLSGGSQYEVIINQDLTSTLGTTIDPDPEILKRWSFRTSVPELLSIEPDPNIPVLLDDPFILTFNQSMDRDAIEAAFQFLDSGENSLTGQFEWNDQSTELTFTPDEVLDRRTMYTLSIDETASATSGSAIAEAIGYSYMTIPELDISGSSPPPGEPVRVYFGFASLTLNLNAPLGIDNIKDYITVSPEVEGLRANLSTDKDSVFLSGFFIQNTTYTITISRSITDKWGGTPTKPLTVVMKTAQADPSISIPLFMSGIQEIFFTPDDPVLPIQASNISGLNLSSSTISLSEYINLQQMGYEDKKEYQPENETTRYINLGLKNRPSTNVEIPLVPSGRTLATGLYYFHLDSPDISRQNFQSSPIILGVVSDINMTIKRNAEQLNIWLMDVKQNVPVSNQEVKVFDRWSVQINSAVTDENGLCIIEVPKAEDSLPLYYIMTGEPGQANFGFSMPNWSNGISGWDFDIDTDLTPYNPHTYLYTDRPIYRPGQTVNYRGIIRNEDNGRYSPADIEEVSVNILSDYDMAAASRKNISTEVLEVSAYGTFSGSVIIPDDASPGYYQIEVEDLPYTHLDFQVAAYRKPEYEISIAFDGSKVIADQDLTARIEANYYFGAPLSNQAVNWALYADRKFFSLPGGYSTGKVDLSWLEYDWAFAFANDLGDLVLEGNGTLNPQGKLQIKLSPQDFNDFDPELYQTLTLEATISDESQLSVSNRSTVNYLPEDYFIGIHPEAIFAETETEIGFSIQTVDDNKKPVTEKTLEASFQKVTWIESSTYSVTYDGPSLIPEYTTVSTATVVTDLSGKARLVFTPPEPGTYQLELRGDNAVSQRMIWASGAGSVNWPSLPNQQITLQADKDAYLPGQQANIFISNPFGENARAMITTERSKVMSTSIITIDNASHELVLDLTEEDAPNIILSVVLIGNDENGRLDFRIGYLNIPVSPSAQTLDVNLSSNADIFHPQDEVDFSILVRDANGDPVQGEFSLSLVDKAVLALADPNAPEIIDAFYGSQPLGVVTSLTFANYARRITLAPPGLGGGGGMGLLSPSVREEFKDTAYWNGTIETDENGRAAVRVDLPDNLTTWVANLRGTTMDTEVGESNIEILTSKDLLIRPITPRFLVAGDHVELAAVVHNNTNTQLNLDVTLDGEGFILDDDQQTAQRLQLPAQGQERVNWWVTIQDTDQLDLVFEADAGTLQDASRPVWGDLPILKYSVPTTYATAGIVSNDEEKLEIINLPRSFTPTGGELSVELSPSLVSAITGNLQSLDTCQFDFSECILSSLLPNLAAYKMLNDLEIEDEILVSDLKSEINKALEKVLGLQNDDGGWGWYATTPSNSYMTSYALLSLQIAKEGKWDVEDSVMVNAQTFLINALSTPEMLNNNWQYDRLVFQHYILNRSRVENMNSWRLYEHRDKLEPWAKALLALTLHEENPEDNRINDLLSGLGTDALRTATGAHWDDSGESKQNLSTPNFNTAVVLYALNQIDPENPLIPQAAQYLLFNQPGFSGWYSRFESAWILFALSDTARTQNDVRPSFAYRAEFNTEEITSGMVNDLSEAESISVSVPFSRFDLEGQNLLKIKQIGGSGNLYYRTFMQINQKADNATPVNKGLAITRQYYESAADCKETTCAQVTTTNLSGDDNTIIARLNLTVPEDMYHVVIEDHIPSGMELYDPSLKISQQGSQEIEDLPYDESDPFDSGWGWWYFNSPRIYDDHITWMAYYLPAGTYQLVYRLIPTQAGDFQVIPAHAYQYYYPEVEGTSAGAVFKIER